MLNVDRQVRKLILNVWEIGEKANSVCWGDR